MNKYNNIQILRAICIIAVLVIHTCPSGILGVFMRPFVNFCVGTFIFISGYLTKHNIPDIKAFYKKRLVRVFIPYTIWSIVYGYGGGGYKKFIIDFLTARCCGIYYYIFVYAQLVILTPIIIKLLKKKAGFVALMSLTPLMMIFQYILNFLNHPLPSPANGIFFPTWISYYCIGLVLGENKESTKVSLNKSFIIILIGLMLQIGEGVLWYRFGNYGMATTQIKLTCFITNIGVMLAIAGLINIKLDYSVKLVRLFIKIGDFSFGIYLTHMLLITFLKKVLVPIIHSTFPTITLLALVLEFIIIWICHKVLSDKWLGYLGFK